MGLICLLKARVDEEKVNVAGKGVRWIGQETERSAFILKVMIAFSFAIPRTVHRCSVSEIERQGDGSTTTSATTGQDNSQPTGTCWCW